MFLTTLILGVCRGGWAAERLCVRLRLYCIVCNVRGARDRRQDTKDKLFVRLLLDKFIVCLDQHGTITVPAPEPRTKGVRRRNYPAKQPAEAEQRLIPKPKPAAASSVET